METNFSPQQLTQPGLRLAEAELRRCVHCGFCTATCPTYVLLGDELDSPRGRIYLIKDLLENERRPDAQLTQHIDRCLSCLSCNSTCPSGVNYMHLVDQTRPLIEQHYRRPWRQRLFRAFIAHSVPHRRRFRWLLRLGRGVAPLLRGPARLARLNGLLAMLQLLPAKATAEVTAIPRPNLPGHGQIALFQACVEPVLQPQIVAASRRLLARMGWNIVELPGEERCCGALRHHLGHEQPALAQARATVRRYLPAINQDELAAIVTTASGCGAQLKNYGMLLQDDPELAEAAARFSALVRDISEFLITEELPLSPTRPGLKVAYQSACSLQHGQGIRKAPQDLLRRAGFEVLEPAEAHLCCGSAGSYNLLQPKLAGQLRDRKLQQLQSLQPAVIASGNIGCLSQLASGTGTPVVHTIELLDWACGGPPPPALGCELS